jgi:hypothetical protein
MSSVITEYIAPPILILSSMRYPLSAILRTNNEFFQNTGALLPSQPQHVVRPGGGVPRGEGSTIALWPAPTLVYQVN